MPSLLLAQSVSGVILLPPSEDNEMRHMKQVQSSVQSTYQQSKQGCPKKFDRTKEIEAAAEDAMATPIQTDGNDNTHLVYMSIIDSKGLVCSNQTGMFPRISNRGMKYLCIFYTCDANFIKSVPIKSREKRNYSAHTKKSTTSANNEVSNQNYTS